MIAATAGGAAVSIERAAGWSRQLRLTPLHPVSYISLKAIAAMTTGLVSVVVTNIVGGWPSGPDAVDRWILAAALCWVCSIVFAAFGLFMGYLLPSENAMQMLGPALAIMAFLGGLFVPVDHGSHVRDDREVHADVRRRRDRARPAHRGPQRRRRGQRDRVDRGVRRGCGLAVPSRHPAGLSRLPRRAYPRRRTSPWHRETERHNRWRVDLFVGVWLVFLIRRWLRRPRRRSGRRVIGVTATILFAVVYITWLAFQQRRRGRDGAPNPAAALRYRIGVLVVLARSPCTVPALDLRRSRSRSTSRRRRSALPAPRADRRRCRVAVLIVYVPSRARQRVRDRAGPRPGRHRGQASRLRARTVAPVGARPDDRPGGRRRARADGSRPARHPRPLAHGHRDEGRARRAPRTRTAREPG